MKVGIYRIVGSELPPRDMPLTRARVTEFILEHEARELPERPARQHWIVNRILDHGARRTLQHALDRWDAHYSIVPIEVAAVKKATDDQAKLLAAIAINRVRNECIADGRNRGYDWTIVLDGDCMFTHGTFARFCEVAAKTSCQYLGLPSRRAIVFGDGTIQHVAELSEPMLAFRKDAPLRFDPNLPFGAGEKLQLCGQLGYSMEPGHVHEIVTPGQCENAGWVTHISLDPAAAKIEENGELRNNLRAAGLAGLLAHATAERPANAHTPFNLAFRDIPGFFDYQGPYSALAAAVPDSLPIVEVGSWLGRSASYLARDLQLYGKTNPLYCVDTWTGGTDPQLTKTVAMEGGPSAMLQLFLQYTAPHRPQIRPLMMDSVAAADLFEDESLIAVFLDAGHGYQDLVRELPAWYRKLMPGGLFFGHDYVPGHPTSRDGVVRAVDEFFADRALELRPASRVWKHVKPGGGVRIWG